MADGGMIKLTPGLLEQQAKQIMEAKEEHDQAIVEIKSLIEGLQGEFQGKAAKAYFEKFDAMQQTFNDFSERLEDLSKKLDDIAIHFEDMDNLLANW